MSDTDGCDSAVDGFGINCGGFVATEAEQYSAIGSVSYAGECERSVELGFNACNMREARAFLQIGSEAMSCAHGSHGV